MALPASCLENGWSGWPPSPSPMRPCGALLSPRSRGFSRPRHSRSWRWSVTAWKRRSPMIDVALASGVIAVVRLQQAAGIPAVAAALSAGGVNSIEITLTTPGALTPTELLAAWRAGARLVKLFPAGLLGPPYIREVLAPLPFLRLVPSGGVSLENAGEWIRAGAVAVSVGSALVSASLVRDEAWAELTARARALVESVAAARSRLTGAPA